MIARFLAGVLDLFDDTFAQPFTPESIWFVLLLQQADSLLYSVCRGRVFNNTPGPLDVDD
jgi:hypothetical protein